MNCTFHLVHAFGGGSEVCATSPLWSRHMMEIFPIYMVLCFAFYFRWHLHNQVYAEHFIIDSFIIFILFSLPHYFLFPFSVDWTNHSCRKLLLNQRGG